MTRAHIYKQTKGRDERQYSFIDGKRVSAKAFHKSTSLSEAIKSQPRSSIGRFLQKPEALRRRPRIEIRFPPTERPQRRFAAKIKARPKVGRIGDEYIIVTIHIEGPSMPSESEWLELSNTARDDLIAFEVKETREL